MDFLHICVQLVMRAIFAQVSPFVEENSHPQPFLVNRDARFFELFEFAKNVFFQKTSHYFANVQEPYCSTR